jgi:hypothetical protein
VELYFFGEILTKQSYLTVKVSMMKAQYQQVIIMAAQIHITFGQDHKTLGIYLYTGGHSGLIQETSHANISTPITVFLHFCTEVT